MKKLLLFYLLLTTHLLSAQCLDELGIGSFEVENFSAEWFTGTQELGEFVSSQDDKYDGARSLKVVVTKDNTWEVRMFQKTDCYFTKGIDIDFKITFAAKGAVGSKIAVTLMDDKTNNVADTIELTSTEWTTYTTKLTSTTESVQGRIKIGFASQGTYYFDALTLHEVRKTQNWYVSANSGNDNLNTENGSSTEKPFKTLQYAYDNAWNPGDTIFVMNGTYNNKNYNTGRVNNGSILSLKDEKMGLSNGWLTIKNYEGHSPKLVFDGSGGIIGNAQYTEISGLEIEGPNQKITLAEAEENRLIQDNYYKGRGVAIWNGHHIKINNMKVHDCPNSGLRVNNGDYCEIENNHVYNCTWWSSNAESAIVFAQSKDVDTRKVIKMRIIGNKVHHNENRIPYYNKNYTGADGSDYGTEAQDYIIDGSGCYITRNNDQGTGSASENPNGQYNGMFYFANNVSYENGINGLVVHKTDGAIVSNNTIYMNGSVPLEKGRQRAGGITIHSSKDVKMYNNISWTRFEDDYGYKIYERSLSTNLEASNNILFVGKSDYTEEQYTLVDPEFVDAENYDLRIKATSPAIDAAWIHLNLPEYDFSGKQRDDTPDIGAYEYAEALDTDGDGIVDAEDECPEDPENKCNEDAVTAVDEVLIEMSIYPNPTSGIVNFSQSINYEIYSLLGELLITGHGKQVDLSGCQEGIYLLKTTHKSFKIIKK